MHVWARRDRGHVFASTYTNGISLEYEYLIHTVISVFLFFSAVLALVGGVPYCHILQIGNAESVFIGLLLAI